MFGRWTESVWRMDGECLDDGMDSVCLEDGRRVFGGLMNDIWMMDG